MEEFEIAFHDEVTTFECLWVLLMSGRFDSLPPSLPSLSEWEHERMIISYRQYENFFASQQSSLFERDDVPKLMYDMHMHIFWLDRMLLDVRGRLWHGEEGEPNLALTHVSEKKLAFLIYESVQTITDQTEQSSENRRVAEQLFRELHDSLIAIEEYAGERERPWRVWGVLTTGLKVWVYCLEGTFDTVSQLTEVCQFTLPSNGDQMGRALHAIAVGLVLKRRIALEMSRLPECDQKGKSKRKTNPLD